MRMIKRFTAVLTAAVIVFCAAIPFRSAPASAADDVVFSGITGLSFSRNDPFKGVDVSSVISLENSGVVFRNRNGEPQDLFQTLAYAGVNCVRVRIWNDPYHSQTRENYGGGICDVNCAVQIAERCAAAGLSLLVDFHYSDFWADPGKQNAPKAWRSYSVAQKADAIYQFTLDTLNQLSETGVQIAMVQVGNETTTGMCGVMLADYDWSDAGWRDLCTLFSAGAKAVRDFSSKTLVALHFTNPEKTSNIMYLAKSVAQNHVDYDVFATSYYPYWHGTLKNLTDVLTSVSQTYGKKVAVTETSWVRTLDDGDRFGNTIGSRDKIGNYASYDISPAGQTAFLHDLFTAVAAIPGGRGIGVFYWEPAWLPVGNDQTRSSLWKQFGSGWATQAAGEYDDSARQYYGGSAVDNESLFSADGKPLDSLYFFGSVHGDGSSVHQDDSDNLLLNPGFEADGGWSASPRGWSLQASASEHFDVRAEDPQSGNYALHWYTKQPFENSIAETSVTVRESGNYRCSVYFQGDEQSFCELAVSCGGNTDIISCQGQGWSIWQNPIVEIQANAGETITVRLRVSGAAESYGSVDDCALVRIGDAEQNSVKGDLNHDGKCDSADCELLLSHLLNIQSLSNDQMLLSDMNADSNINAIDLTYMKRLILNG